MLARKFQCTVEEIDWISPTTMRVRFHCPKPFHFEPGQFISLVIPSLNKKERPIKRLYSLASSPDEAQATGTYELGIRYVKGGVGSDYLATCGHGDKIEIFAPYGDFQYRVPAPGRAVCLIGTGTGLSPIRSIVTSSLFLNNLPRKSLCLLGVRNEKEKLYEQDFALAPAETVYALSQPEKKGSGYEGRVTDFLRQAPPGWDWHNTDFYLCGNGKMITEAELILRGQGVDPASIQKEAFSSTSARPSSNVVAFPSRSKAKSKWSLLGREKFGSKV